MGKFEARSKQRATMINALGSTRTSGVIDARNIIQKNKRKRNLELRGVDSSHVDEEFDEQAIVKAARVSDHVYTYGRGRGRGGYKGDLSGRGKGKPVYSQPPAPTNKAGNMAWVAPHLQKGHTTESQPEGTAPAADAAAPSSTSADAVADVPATTAAPVVASSKGWSRGRGRGRGGAKVPISNKKWVAPHLQSPAVAPAPAAAPTAVAGGP